LPYAEKNLELNSKKTKLCAEEVTYIGHKLIKDGVKIDDEKVKAMLDMSEPVSGQIPPGQIPTGYILPDIYPPDIYPPCEIPPGHMPTTF